MKNAIKSDFRPKNGGGEELTARNEKSRQRANGEATGQTRPHFNSPEEVHAYYKAMERTREQEETPIIKSLKEYSQFTKKAEQAIKPLSEGLKASLNVCKASNELDLPGGGYNPNYIEWVEGNLTLAALALCNILMHDPIEERKGYIAVWKETAENLITDMQHYVMNFQKDASSIRYALEQYNYYVAYMEERGLKEDFDQYVTRLFLA